MGQELQLELQCLFLGKKYLRQALKYVSLTFSHSFLLSDEPSVLSADISSTSFFSSVAVDIDDGAVWVFKDVLDCNYYCKFDILVVKLDVTNRISAWGDSGWNFPGNGNKGFNLKQLMPFSKGDIWWWEKWNNNLKRKMLLWLVRGEHCVDMRQKTSTEGVCKE